MSQGSGGQALVVLPLVQEEAKRMRLGHPELGGTELVQRGNRGSWGHGQRLGGAATAGVLMGYAEEVLGREKREQELSLPARLKAAVQALR